MRMIGKLGLGVTMLAAAASGAAAQQATDWSGFYASVFAGYALDPTQARASETVYPPMPLGGYTLGGTQRRGNTRIESLFGGIGAGYDHQIGQIGQIVLGVDGAVHIGGLSKGSYDTQDFTAFDAVDTARIGTSDDLKVNVDWYSTFAGTFGLAFSDDWLVSLKGGVAVANVSSSSTAKIDYSASAPGFPGGVPLPIGVSSSTTTASQFLLGPTFGLGVEKKLNQNVSVGAEYAYVGLPTLNAPRANIPLLGLGGAGTTQVELGFHTVKATLKYHF